MAENTTTYKAVIDTEVKGKEEIEGLGDEADKTGGKFKSLKSQIRETTVELQKLEDQGKSNTKEFTDLKNKLDELQDAQDRVNFKSKQFGDQIAALPGPIGKLGGGLKSAQDAIVTFGTATTVALGVVGLIVAAFAAMKEALSKTTEGQAVLNKVTDAFSKLLAPVMTLISSVAIPVFETLANIIGKVAEAFEFVAIKLGFAKSEIQKFDTAAKEASKNALKSAQEDLDNMAKVIQMQKDAATKAEADRKARRQKELQERADQEAEALREEQERLDGILKEYEKRRKARAKLNFEIEKQENLTTKTAEAKKIEDERIRREKESDDKIKYLKINTVEEQEKAIKGIKKSSLLEQAEAVSAGLKQETEYVQLTTEDKIGIISDGLGAVASLVGENTAAGKALAVAQAVMDTYAGANKALAAYPPPFGAIAAGTVVVAGLLNVKKILSTQLPKMPGARSTPSMNASISTPSVPTMPTMQAPQITTTGGNNPTSQLAQTLANATKPIEAYVVSTKVSTSQALDRRVNRAATLSGG
jgi:hypothetical protein